MITYLLLGVLLLAVVILIGRWFVGAEAARIARALRWTGGAILVALAGYLAATGRLGAAIMAAAVLVPLFMRWRALIRRMKSAGGPSPGRTSEVETAWLRMSLDHDSGDMDGEVLAGPHAGRRLSEMELAALLELIDSCASDDPPSAQVLEAYLDRAHGAAWREAAEARAAGGGSGAGEAGGGFAPGRMSREEAYEILGLEPGADDAAVKAAHHRLMLKLHPDQGGSTYLATKINQAKEVLLGRG